jgi:hypothetical protein
MKLSNTRGDWETEVGAYGKSHRNKSTMPQCEISGSHGSKYEDDNHKALYPRNLGSSIECSLLNSRL